DLVDAHQREVERHELDDRTQAIHGGANTDTGETKLRDGRVNNAVRAEFVEHTLAHFVSAVVLSNFLAHKEDLFVSAHFFNQCFTKGLSELNFSHDDL